MPATREPSYEPLSSDSDSQSQPSEPSQKSRSRLVTVRRILLFAVTVTLVSLAAYRSEQWYTEQAVLDLGTDTAPGNTAVEDNVQEPAQPPIPANDTDMVAGGKYSVGYFVNW
ncbi:hypothetical protein C2E23DRAFT_14418 [Lenzites betulinus]|nr:hypothetical protein C2E23DRAFT_14418 [Lenzites betulinus]